MEFARVRMTGWKRAYVLRNEAQAAPDVCVWSGVGRLMGGHGRNGIGELRTAGNCLLTAGVAFRGRRQNRERRSLIRHRFPMITRPHPAQPLSA
jgi:hypothetical protein